MVRKVTDAGSKRSNARMYEEDEAEDYGMEPPKADPHTVMAEARFLQKSGQYSRAIERYSKVNREREREREREKRRRGEIERKQ